MSHALIASVEAYGLLVAILVPMAAVVGLVIRFLPGGASATHRSDW